jgi:hypothetical protein
LSNGDCWLRPNAQVSTSCLPRTRTYGISRTSQGAKWRWSCPVLHDGHASDCISRELWRQWTRRYPAVISKLKSDGRGNGCHLLPGRPLERSRRGYAGFWKATPSPHSLQTKAGAKSPERDSRRRNAGTAIERPAEVRAPASEKPGGDGWISRRARVARRSVPLTGSHQFFGFEPVLFGRGFRAAPLLPQRVRKVRNILRAGLEFRSRFALNGTGDGDGASARGHFLLLVRDVMFPTTTGGVVSKAPSGSIGNL